MNTHSRAACLLLLTVPTFALAQDDASVIEEIIVLDQFDAADASTVTLADEALLDTANALKSIPGANVNGNGLITGIAQYRGMYGDRVAVTIDNHAIVSGGPNSMDAPLSYVSPMITEAVVVERGIASVSSASESIGGHLSAQLARGSFGGEEVAVSGFVGSRYSTNGDVSTTAGRLTLANNRHRFSTLAELDSGDDLTTPIGDIRPSSVDRRRYDVSYAFANGDDHLVVFAGKLETKDSGTPALPMDIRIIDTDLFGGHFLYTLSSNFALEGRISANEVEHVMDNFGLRNAPPPMMQRETLATGSGQTMALAGKLDFEASSLRIGLEQTRADHDAVISNPNNNAFRILNFSGVERDVTSAFGEWSFEREQSAIELGVSVRRVATNAGDIAAMGMMSPAVATLTNAFNDADRELEFDDVDAVAKYRYRAGNNLDWHLQVARKSRAPSYQELYLWLPMQSTGGLADGRTYIGDLNLDSERSNEINVGFMATKGRFSMAPQVFYKEVDGYIQGTPSDNAAANMVAMMMGGQPALRFANTDARIWGLDLAATAQISERVFVDGVATFVRGRRTDVADNLYRLAPFNGSLGLRYARESWTVDARLVAYGSQRDVSAFNGEQPTDAYEIVNAAFAWTPTPALRIETRVDNLFDTTYQEHLAGINRAAGSDIPVGSRLYGAERAFGIGILYSF